MTADDADAARLVVHLVTPDGELWAGHASSVRVPAWDGSLGILPRHQPFVALLRRGTLRVHPVDADAVDFVVRGGFLSLDHDVVTVLADEARPEDAAGDG